FLFFIFILYFIKFLFYFFFPDPKFVHVFLLTYRSFMTSKELLEWLILRFDTPGMENVDHEEFINSKQVQIRLRVFNVLKQWLDKHFYDFKEDAELISQLQNFLDDVMVPEGMIKPANQLRHILQKHL